MLRNLELLRVAGFFAVVLIHANSVGLFGEDRQAGFVIDEICRFAVPTFFVLSGYFWKPSVIAAPFASARILFVRLAPLYAFWLVFYFAAEFSEFFYPRKFEAGFRWITIPFTGGPGIHLWFLPALFIGSAFCWACLRALGVKATFILAGGLYSLGVAIGCYGSRFGLHLPLIAYRNGLMEAPLLLLCGYWLRVRPIDLAKPAWAAIAVGGIALHLLEGIQTGQFPQGHDYSFGTPLAAVGLVGLFGQWRSADDRGWGRDVLGAYLVHFFIIKTVAAHLSSTGTVPAVTVSVGVGCASLLLSRYVKALPLTRRLVSIA